MHCACVCTTNSGLQREVVRLPGPPVSIVAGGVLLGIVYHAAAPAMGSQVYNFSLVLLVFNLVLFLVSLALLLLRRLSMYCQYCYRWSRLDHY
jgi:hypothetical protein